MTDYNREEREALIKEAAKAMYFEDCGVAALGDDAEPFREMARVAFAVFEKAHAPTDDEREAQGWREAELYASADGDARDDFMTGWRTADRLRRSEVPEPQGEPTDAHEIEFPFTHEGVTLEQDYGGVWVTIEGGSVYRPYWIGPKALAALRAAGSLSATLDTVPEQRPGGHHD